MATEFNPDLFVQNLITSSNADGALHEDGRALNMRDRLSDIWNGRSAEVHVVKLCDHLNERSVQELLAKLSVDDRLSILSKVKGICERLRSRGRRQHCEKIVEQFEIGVFMTAGKTERMLPALFKKIGATKSQKGAARELRKVELVLSHASKGDQVQQALSSWKNLSGKAKKLKRQYQKVDPHIMHRLLAPAERLLMQGPTNAEGARAYVDILTKEIEAISHEGRPGLTRAKKHYDMLSKIMDQNEGNPEVLRILLRGTNDLLAKIVFSRGMHFSETYKDALLTYRAFFPMVNKHLAALKTGDVHDERAHLDLRLKMANLPCPEARSTFPQLALTEQDQVAILVNGFQKKEDEHVTQLIALLKRRNLRPSALSRIAKLISETGPLSSENRDKLATALCAKVGSTPAAWDTPTIAAWLKKECPTSSFGVSKSALNKLKRNVKAKAFFAKQIGLPDDNTLIPRWYHATSERSATAILSSGRIEVRHQGLYEGAWVSTSIEDMFGDHVLAVSHKVSQIHGSAAIRLQFEDRRWRGAQDAISVAEPHLAAIGVGAPSWTGKLIVDKVAKAALVRQLQAKGFPHVKIFSIDQLRWINRAVLEMLGTPNLSDAWWGVGDMRAPHQEEMQQLVGNIKLDPVDLRPHGDRAQNQLAIGRVVQQAALPLYKKAMPRHPTYRSEASNFRVRLDQNYRFDRIAAGIQEANWPARKDHGTMHCARATLWTTLLDILRAQKTGQRGADPILVASAAAFHDTAREDEALDRWDSESADLHEQFLKKCGLGEEERAPYVHAIRYKDPRDGYFATDAQQDVHDADCLEIIRVIGTSFFRKSELRFYRDASKKERQVYDKIIAEVAAFIEWTEDPRIKTILEHDSKDFYGDLVRLLFAKKKNFPLLTTLLKDDMAAILRMPQTKITERLLSR